MDATQIVALTAPKSALGGIFVNTSISRRTSADASIQFAKIKAASGSALLSPTCLSFDLREI
jgi:hypothetical protein